MAAVVATDWSVAANGDIRYTGAGTNNTVIELHRWLGTLADDASSSGDDLLDITDITSSDRSTDNIVTLNSPYNIDAVAAEHLYDGSITQASGATVYSGLVVLGNVVSGTNLQIVQDNALLTNYWGTGLNADTANNILLRIMVQTRVSGLDIDGKRLRVQARELGDTYAEFSLTGGLGNSVAAISTATDLNNQTIAATISGWASITNTEGLQLLDVDGNAVNEEYYSNWTKGSQSINELYERTKWLQRRTTVETLYGMNGELFRGITHQIVYDGELGGPFTQNEKLAWGTNFAYTGEAAGPFTVGEKVTFGTSGAVGELIYLNDAGATGTVTVAIESGTVATSEVMTGATSGASATTSATTINGNGIVGGTGTLLAIGDDGTTGDIYIQLLTGAAPVDNLLMTGSTSNATALVNVTVTSRTISPAYIGSSTGSAIIGAYGIGITPADLTSSDQLFDLTNTLLTPPNNVTFTVSGLISTEDRVLVGPESAGALLESQLAVSGAHTAGGGTLTVTTTIPSDTPSSGTVRAFNGSTYDRLPYASYTGAIFTLTGTLPNNIANAANAFISYIDLTAAATTASFTSVYNADRALFIRVRDGGATPIKTFETTGTLGSAGGSTSAIRTSDA
jgi:hypothetical protein